MNYDIIRLLENIKNNSDCLINRSCGQPLLRTGEKLPDDLKLFYEKCGGVKFNNTRFQFEIVSPKEMVLANPIIVGELCEEDISSEWSSGSTAATTCSTRERRTRSTAR